MTDADVTKILKLWADGWRNYTAIGEVFGVNRTTIRRVIAGDSWKHIQRQA